MVRSRSSPRPRKRIALAMLLAIAAGAFGCEVILGMDGHDARLAEVTPVGGDAGKLEAAPGEDSANGDGGPTAPPCVLPSTGNTTLRIGNLVPSTARVDACLARSGGPSPIDGMPIVASATGSCPAGLGYKDITVPFGVEPGTYAVTFVPAGSACSATPVATGMVTTSATGGSGVYLLGGGTAPATTLTLAEETPPGLESAFRFVHAIADLGPLDFDLTVPGSVPPMINAVVCPAVKFGTVGVSTNPQLPSDADGYEQISLLGGTLAMGAGPAGGTSVTISAVPVFSEQDSYSAFAIGLPGDPSFPEELYVCDERQTDGVLTQCANGGSIDVTVDVFDPYLWGPFAPLVPLRQPAVISALAALEADVVCLPDAFPDSLDATIMAEVKARFPYSVHFDDTLTTPIDDPTLADGGVPPPPTEPPCGGGLDSLLEPFLSCVEQYCTDPVGSDDASVGQEPSACITANCSAPAEALVLGTDVQTLRCWTCALFSLQGTATIAQARSECTTDVHAGLAFTGQSGTVVLSRYPITNAEQWVLPATDWRSAIVRAPITLPGGKALDTYCMLLTDPVSSLTVPYTGAYGNGTTDVTAWLAELTLQVQKVVAYVQRKSPGIPAVVAGEFYTGPAASDGTPSLNPTAYQIFASTFALAATSSGPPGCTFCATNPILSPPGSTPSDTNELTSYPLLANIPVTDVRSTSLELETPFLDAGLTDAGAYIVPLSPYYDYRATLRIRP
ncbi:MAG: hypothetical protein ABSE49_09110 [Polyangiaceae bacterium]|jgi:hypothetical protein